MTTSFHPSARPIVAFTGAFGSGKTEVAVNYCRAALANGKRVCLVDLDVVTPYFRVGDYRRELEQEGIPVIAAPGALASFELPALPPEIAGALDSSDLHAVLDVGGDPVGARLLATYADRISKRGYDLWLVVNPYRPDTSDSRSTEEQAGAIESSCGLRLTGVVANPNLGPMTQWSHIERGLRVVEQAAGSLGLPVVLTAVAQELTNEDRGTAHALLSLRLVVRPPWGLARGRRGEARAEDEHCG